ncbi:MAG: methyltransferase domain-containing protein [Campylobacterota bacterium]|nr:methyltransferase domain-containing protein [Campylobacterota bacterium]
MKSEKTKVEMVDGVEYTYSSEWIKELETEEHWKLYWQQQKLMQTYLRPKDTILEIGVGTSFTANYLKSKGFDVLTFDIDKAKQPDIVGNIVEHNWQDSQYSHILAFEVFEHIPFEEFKKSLIKLKKVCKKNIFISLPLNEKLLFEFEFKIPKFKKNHLRFPIAKNKITTLNHFWEIGYEKYSEAFVETMFKESGYNLVEKLQKSSFIYYVLSTND